MERAFFSRYSIASFSNESVPLSTSSACTVVTFVSDEKNSQVLIGTEPEPIQLDEFENDSDSDYDETESEEIVDLLLVDEIMRAGMSSLKGWDQKWKVCNDGNCMYRITNSPANYVHQCKRTEGRQEKIHILQDDSEKEPNILWTVFRWRVSKAVP